MLLATKKSKCQDTKETFLLLQHLSNSIFGQLRISATSDKCSTIEGKEKENTCGEENIGETLTSFSNSQVISFHDLRKVPGMKY